MILTRLLRAVHQLGFNKCRTISHQVLCTNSLFVHKRVASNLPTSRGNLLAPGEFNFVSKILRKQIPVHGAHDLDSLDRGRPGDSRTRHAFAQARIQSKTHPPRVVHTTRTMPCAGGELCIIPLHNNQPGARYLTTYISLCRHAASAMATVLVEKPRLNKPVWLHRVRRHQLIYCVDPDQGYISNDCRAPSVLLTTSIYRRTPLRLILGSPAPPSLLHVCLHCIPRFLRPRGGRFCR